MRYRTCSLLACAALAAAVPAHGASISGMAWGDFNQNGRRDVGELPLYSRNVTLHVASDHAQLQTTTTNSDGRYVFTGIPDGLVVRVCTRRESGFSPRNAAPADIDNDFGGDPARPDCTLPRAALGAQIDVDAGLLPWTVSLGNRVWLDRNGNGVQDTGEPGIAGIALELYHAGNGMRYATARTNANGTYQLLAPAVSTWRLVLHVPDGATPAPVGAGGDPLLDSDFVGVAPGLAELVFTTPTNLISTVVLDAGLMVPNPVNASLELAVPPLAVPGSELAWSLRLRNADPARIDSLRLRAPTPANVANVLWECSASGGATCGSSAGSGSIDRVLALPAGGELQFGFVGQVSFAATDRLHFEARADINAPQHDFQLFDNLVRATSRFDPDLLFDDHFESP